MPIKLKTMYGLAWLVSSCVLTLLSFTASAQNVPGIAQLLSCDDNGALCTEVYDSIGYGGAILATTSLRCSFTPASRARETPWSI